MQRFVSIAEHDRLSAGKHAEIHFGRHSLSGVQARCASLWLVGCLACIRVDERSVKAAPTRSRRGAKGELLERLMRIRLHRHAVRTAPSADVKRARGMLGLTAQGCMPRWIMDWEARSKCAKEQDTEEAPVHMWQTHPVDQAS